MWWLPDRAAYTKPFRVSLHPYLRYCRQLSGSNFVDASRVFRLPAFDSTPPASLECDTSMPRPWHVDARIIVGPATNPTELLDYLRPPQVNRDAEPPRKRRKTEQTSTARVDIDGNDAVLLTSEALHLVCGQYMGNATP